MRTKLSNRRLPNYSKGEEIFNMVSHIVGGGIGLIALVACPVAAAFNQNVWNVVSGIIYGFSIILLYTMSSIYHGLTIEIPKKVFQIFDHCTIFIFIAGTYTPVLLGRFRELYPVDAWVIFGVVWGQAVLGIVLNAIDLNKFRVMSMVIYLGMGWCIVFRLNQLLEAYAPELFFLLLAGGLAYTLGAAFYVAGRRKKFMHAVFHLFADAATILHFIGIVAFVMPT